ncbi:MAG: amino acid ABC transporter substrate-binding protein [Xanthobacteraceae bacterium]
MRRRELLKYAAAATVVGPLGLRTARAADPLKIGVVGPKTGPLAAGAALIHFPNFVLWAKEVNDRGGLKLKDGPRKVELIEYDDRTQPPETIKAVERLATVDKADFIMPVFATGFNLAAAPVYAKYGYPLITVSCVTDQIDQLIKQFPNMFIVSGATTQFAAGTISVLKKLKDGGQIGNKVAVVNVADDFGIELANAGRPLFKEAGFEIVYDKSYPLGTQDLTPVVKAAKAAAPDAFVAWSYPPDTFALLEQAKIAGLTVKAYYSAIATAFPSFHQKYGAVAENVLGLGGVQSNPELEAYYKAFKNATGLEADYAGAPSYYAALQIITQAIEAVGSMDLNAITAHIKANKFKTIVGELDIRNQRADKFWTVGQWQNGKFVAVNGVGYGDFAPVNVKTWA